MFGEGLFVGFYWGPRRDGLNVCTERAMRLLKGMQQVHPRLFGLWYASLDFEEKPLEVSAVAREQIRNLLAAGVTYSDVGNELFEDLGYSVRIHTSQDPRSFVQVSFSCDVTVPQLGGKCLIHSPMGTPASAELADLPLLLRICTIIVECWEPDDGIVSCNALTDAIEPDSMRFNTGWIIYRSKEHGPLPKLPSTAHVELVNDQGYLVVASKDVTIPPTPQAIEDVRAVYEALGPAPKLHHV